MITLFGHQVEIYQAILLTYVLIWSFMYGVRNTFVRFVSLFTGVYEQSNLGIVLDALWYGCIFILVGTLV